MVIHKIFGVERDIDIPAECFPTPEELVRLEAPLGPHEHGWFDSCVKGAKLLTRAFLPPNGKPKAMLIFLHGVAGYSGEAFQMSDGRVTNMALFRKVLNDANIALFAFDLYGHGFSEGERFFIPSYQESLRDSVKYIHLVDERFEGSLPVFLGGISYGGNLAIQISRLIQDDPSLGPKKFVGDVLFCPAITGDLPPAPVYYTLRYILAPLCPYWTPFFMPNPLSFGRIWKDPEMVRLRRDNRMMEMKLGGSGDPLRLGTALALVKSLDHVVHKSIPGFQAPFFLLHGTEDHVVKIEGSELFWRRVDTPKQHREFHHFEGGYHDIMGQKDSQKYMEAAVSWMERQLLE